MNNGTIPEELSNLIKKIQELKVVYREKSNEQQAEFKNIEKISSEIEKFYSEVKEIETRTHLDEINKKLKGKEDILKRIREEVKEAKKSGEVVVKEVVVEKKDFKKSVNKQDVKKQIESLETQLQTKFNSLDDEKKINSKLKELKELDVGDDYESGEKRPLSKLLKQESKLNGQIGDVYKKIRVISKEKKNIYEKVDVLKKERKEKYSVFKEAKKRFLKVSKELKGLFDEEGVLREKHNMPLNKKKENVRIKRKELEEGLFKKGKTLTAEDLLLFQER